MKKWIIISLAIFTFSCEQRELVTTISSKELVNLDYKKLTRIDSATAIQMLNNNSDIYGWPQTLEILKQVMPAGYLTKNLNYEREKAKKDFMENNQFFSYSIKVKGDIYQGVIIRSVNEAEEWSDKAYNQNLFLTKIKNKLKQPILINEYARVMAITGFGITSSTKIYSDHSIEMIMTTNGCSDVIGLDGKTLCDSITITSSYEIDVDAGDISFSSDTVRYEYKM